VKQRSSSCVSSYIKLLFKYGPNNWVGNFLVTCLLSFADLERICNRFRIFYRKIIFLKIISFFFFLNKSTLLKHTDIIEKYRFFSVAITVMHINAHKMHRSNLFDVTKRL